MLDTAAPKVRAVLPLLYVAWADGVLTPSEAETIRGHLRAQDWLDVSTREEICAHLDPQSPPTSTQYFRWVRALRKGAEDAPVTTRCTLAELGMALATVGGDGAALPDASRRALEDIEAALDINGEAVVCDLLGERPEPSPVESETPFDTGAMQGLLDGPHADLREHIRTLLQDPTFAYREELGTDAYREQVLDWCRHLADQGLGALAFPDEYGGDGDMERFIVAFETLAYHDLSLVIKFGVQFGLFGGSIYHLGTKRHHEAYLQRAGTLDLPGCFAMTEWGHGSNVRELETTARYDPATEEFVVNTPHDGARKEWIGNAAAHGQVATVFAQLQTDGEEHGVHAFLVPIRAEDGTPQPRVRIEDCGEKVGLNGVDNGRLWFDQVRIPRENLLDRYAQVDPDGTYDSPIPSSGKRFFTMLSTLIGGRISVARAGLSAAKSGLTIAIRYGNRRRQFGPKDEPEVSLLDYRTHKRRLLPRLATTYALHFALDDLTARFARKGRGESLEAIEAEANALKAYTTWHTNATLQEAREACGGQGYRADTRIGRLRADTDVFTTFEGDNTVLMLQVAKGLLSDFQREFRDMNLWGMARFVADEVATQVQELNPVVTRKTDSEHLRGLPFQKNALTYRAEKQLQNVGRRLQRRIDDGTDPFDAFVDVQDHLVQCARAEAERMVLERFADAIEEVEDAALQDTLTTLRRLFALSRVEEDLGWFLEAGYVSASKAKAIRGAVNDLCDEVRPQAEALVGAFGIPDAVLGAPIVTEPSPGPK
ncbi:acyl-CoA dehydrogenase [Salinibacter altiplanensis]|uniref:acyl-CoA dehydrogenase family protein n=1 Tax=Salinibacter altiplanensis TaxID=1803181 RepID=UPI000C9EFC5D|nr:acyl-CoA dehydrogenase [Salinibacter altiplanensis]